MTITIKTAEQIEKMRIAGQLAASVLEMIEPHVKTGVTTGLSGSTLSQLYSQ